MIRYPRCQCGKVWAPTQQQAEAIHNFITAKLGTKEKVRTYQCAHGAWHWTQAPYKPWRKNSAKTL